jgi:hypothetical protein
VLATRDCLCHFVDARNQSDSDPEEVLAPVALYEDCTNPMSIRTTRKIVKFSNPFSIEGVGRVLLVGRAALGSDQRPLAG